jgi:hypothetical protein
MSEECVLLKWISSNTIGIVTDNAVYHWSMEDDLKPIKMFFRDSNLEHCQIINYRADHSIQSLLLIGIIVDEGRVAGRMQLYSTKRKESQTMEAHAACFTQFKLEGNKEPSTLLGFSMHGPHGGKLNIIEVGQPVAGNRPYSKKAVDVYFPPEAQNDFPVAMQSSVKYDVFYLITKFGYVHIYDVETGTCIFMNRTINMDRMIVTAPYQTTLGTIGVNHKGIVISLAIDQDEIVSYITKTLKNHELANKMASKINNKSCEYDSIKEIGGNTEVVEKCNMMDHYRKLEKMNKKISIILTEHLQLKNIQVNVANIGFSTVTMESDKFICIREKVNETVQVAIVDLADPYNPIRRPITADSVIMHPASKVIALRGDYFLTFLFLF